ncbi:MAG: hypothetical protein ACD_17C00279G0003 [uncultured bacterium]|uniref:hypothetical protein n=1 Tax=Fundidesulfovibrio putealis TaxID=270496 RepID=UPI00028518D9|nr:hypothetical protein [Fundidesulfovibrio putealis]EKE08223.1 MAG: hypothetical protein ACD_17C00279G0003 [uncultured bacterium]
MDYDRLEYSLLLEDWDSVADEMMAAEHIISLTCFEQMLQERRISRSSWLTIMLNTEIYKVSAKFDMMLRAILRYTWVDSDDDLRWHLVSAILSLNGFDFSNKTDGFDCISSIVEFVSKYIGVTGADVLKVVENPDRVSIKLLMASRACPQ